MNWLLTVIVFLPALAGLIALLGRDAWARWVAAAFTLVVFVLSLWLYFGLLNGSATTFGDVQHPQWYVDADWINITLGTFHFRVDYALGADGLSMPLIILNALLTFLAVVGSWHIERRIKLYMAL